MTFPIIIVGAGICGVSTAIWLQRSGHRVLLMVRDGPGTGASYGNSGLLAPWAIDPVNSPTLWKEAPKYLFDPNGPLFMKWGHLPKMVPWLYRFISHATDDRARQIVRNLIPILGAMTKSRNLRGYSEVRSNPSVIPCTGCAMAFTVCSDERRSCRAYSRFVEKGTGWQKIPRLPTHRRFRQVMHGNNVGR